MESLYNWVFNYNPYTKTWRAARRENYSLLFSDESSPSVIKAAQVDILIDIIKRIDGNLSKLNYK